MALDVANRDDHGMNGPEAGACSGSCPRIPPTNRFPSVSTGISKPDGRLARSHVTSNRDAAIEVGIAAL